MAQTSRTPRQRKFQQWLAMPENERNPATQREWATENKIHFTTLSRWKSAPGFRDEVESLAAETLGDDLPDVYAALRREAKAGSAKHIEMYLKLLGKFVERSDGVMRLVVEYGDDDIDDQST